MNQKQKWVLVKYLSIVYIVLLLLNYFRYESNILLFIAIGFIVLLVISIKKTSNNHLNESLNQEEKNDYKSKIDGVLSDNLYDLDDEEYDDPEFDNYDNEKNYKANVARSLMGMFEKNGNPQSNKSQAAFSFLALCANLTKNNNTDSEENILRKVSEAKFGLEMFGFDFEGSEAEDYFVSGPELINGLIMIEHPQMGISQRYMMLRFSNGILRANGPISSQTKNTLKEILNHAFYSSEDIDLLLDDEE